ncbi:hypothetical protein LY76DRAFT_239560 [Colletotrichum caudatum]|nr:hypothetical protein LY76DRAFT_239560 [Colletotrichum caudatum]
MEREKRVDTPSSGPTCLERSVCHPVPSVFVLPVSLPWNPAVEFWGTRKRQSPGKLVSDMTVGLSAWHNEIGFGCAHPRRKITRASAGCVGSRLKKMGRGTSAKLPPFLANWSWPFEQGIINSSAAAVVNPILFLGLNAWKERDVSSSHPSVTQNTDIRTYTRTRQKNVLECLATQALHVHKCVLHAMEPPCCLPLGAHWTSPIVPGQRGRHREEVKAACGYHHWPLYENEQYESLQCLDGLCPRGSCWSRWLWEALPDTTLTTGLYLGWWASGVLLATSQM